MQEDVFWVVWFSFFLPLSPSSSLYPSLSLILSFFHLRNTENIENLMHTPLTLARPISTSEKGVSDGEQRVLSHKTAPRSPQTQINPVVCGSTMFTAAP